ncbi:MAG: FAD-dependent oxidoreductase, partial [Nitrospirota bacterium]
MGLKAERDSLRSALYSMPSAISLIPTMSYSTEHIATDFLIIGGGVAGLRAAIELARSGEVLVVTKDAPSESSSEYAQGGVAVALS